LFYNLIKHLVVADSDHSDPGKRAIMGGCNIEGVDIETTPAEHAGHPAEDAKFVFNQDRYGVFHVDQF